MATYQTRFQHFTSLLARDTQTIEAGLEELHAVHRIPSGCSQYDHKANAAWRLAINQWHDKWENTPLYDDIMRVYMSAEDIA